MSGFDKLKHRIWRDIIIKCLAVGVCCGLFAVGAIMLFCKIGEISLLYSLIGLAALPVAGGITFLVLRTDDAGIAKRIDDELGLGEKTRTMIAYRADTGDMIELQREDTQRVLSSVPSKRIQFGRIWAYAVAAVVAIGVLAAGCAIPAKADRPAAETPPPPPYEMTDWEWQALDELIEYVTLSQADSRVMKPKTLAALNSLKTLLSRGITVDDLSGFVEVTVGDINNAVIEANTQAGMTDSQKSVNSEVGKYTVSKLYEIFALDPPGGDEPGDEPGGEEPGEGGGGTGGVSMGADEKLYVPGVGYVSYNDVIGEYYDEVQKAYREGVITEGEYYDFLERYFKYLNNGTK